MDRSAKTNNRRKILFIDREFQTKFLLHIVLLNLGVCGTFYAAQMFFFHKAYEVGRSIGLDPTHVFFNFVGEQQRFMNMVFVATAIVVSVIIVVFGLVYSNKIAGPLYHLKKHLRGKMAGEIKYDLKFRDGDNFMELAEVVNEYIHSQEKPQKKVKKSA